MNWQVSLGLLSLFNAIFFISSTNEAKRTSLPESFKAQQEYGIQSKVRTNIGEYNFEISLLRNSFNYFNLAETTHRPLYPR